ncbi:MAG: heme lyase CcmF/NrfE family subunit [Anaerolineae bacterium]
MTTLGSIALLVALVVALYTAAAGILGARQRAPELASSARNGVIVFAALMTLAIGSMVYALFTRDFSLELVANHTSVSLPLFPYTLTALWSGQSGSLLFWSWILSLYGLAVVLRKWDTNRDLMPWVIAVLMGIQSFFVLMLNFVSMPFAKMAVTPADGAGLNPLLQHPAMAIHPPMLYLGYVGFTIPFCFAMGALLSGRVDNAWIRTTRRWAMVPWMFLGMGLLLGGRWAYDVLGWGGYWGWDPVENAALMPWLVGTAFLHSVMVQERKGGLKVWNVGLIIITFGLVLFGTFITRSGVIQSVHAFAQSDIGAPFLMFIAAVLILSTGLLFTRLDKLKSENEIDSFLSRELLFLVNNLLFLGAAIAILIGVVWPLLSEIATGETLTVGAPYYNLVVGVIFAGIVLLMGVIPLIGWGGATIARLGRKMVWPLAITLLLTTGAYVAGVRDAVPCLAYGLVFFVMATTLGDMYWATRARQKNTHETLPIAFARLLSRNRRRYGGYLIHLAVMVLAIGVIGSRAYGTDETRSLSKGESFTTGPYTLTFEDLKTNIPDGEGTKTLATVGIFEGDRRITTLYPGNVWYERQQQPETEPAIYNDAPFFRRDLYLIIQAWTDNFQTVSFRAYINPMVSWVWFGGLMFLISTVITLWPDAKESAARVREPAAQPAAAYSRPTE